MLYRIVFGLLAALSLELSFMLWRAHEALNKAKAWAEKRAAHVKADRVVFERHMRKKPTCTGVEGTTILTTEQTSEVEIALPIAHPVDA